MKSMSEAIAGLYEIAKRHPEVRVELYAWIKQYVGSFAMTVESSVLESSSERELRVSQAKRDLAAAMIGEVNQTLKWVKDLGHSRTTITVQYLKGEPKPIL